MAEREANATESVVGRQLDKVIELAGIAALQSCVIAYEPVWAIGTGLTASVADVAEVHGFLRSQLRSELPTEGQALRLLYGGSVKPGNAKELMSVADVDGALVGGASLKAADFLGILAAYR